MRIPHKLLPRLRLIAILAFTAVCAVVFGYLWVNSGGRIPLVTSDGYRVSVDVPEVANLVDDSDVMVAGVKVGKVAQVEPVGGHARVVLQLEKAMPLHQGVTVKVRQKSLVEETYLELIDGSGQPLPNGARLPSQAAKPLTRLDDVLASLDADSRQSLASAVRSLGEGTEGSRGPLQEALRGVGHVGREGKDVLAALHAQSADLKELTIHTATVLASLDSRRGQLGELVGDADELLQATAGARDDIEAIMRALPRTLDAARNATGGLRTLSADLVPVARDLRAAAPDLSAALDELPATSRDLRALVPTLDRVLGKAPPTLQRVPVVADDLARIVPELRSNLAQVNPMLRYLKPYGPDITAFFTNWGQSFANRDVNGHYMRLMLPIDEQTFRGYPVETNMGPLNRKNPYPAPGSQGEPGPVADLDYPRIEQEEG